ncbi:unnamed protein product [Enterobius vermicularis]|uniref:ANK_REP_REGION domain-containing protein n=1 Tax=Enterobius vermicularis TaxID=51028 RepID=A0A0N4VGH7_ENTVE|nr:unnamed protein product [Enterobius vermicularis]
MAKFNVDRVFRYLMEGNINAAHSTLAEVEDLSSDEKQEALDLALIRASKFGDAEIVKAMIGSGANVKAEDFDKRAPLYWASENGYLDVVKVLVDKGACLDAIDLHAVC